MEIKEIIDKNIWEGFLAGCQEKTFLQSWNWGEFSQTMGEKIWRWGVFDHQGLVAVALVEKKASRRGVFLLIPHGPVIKNADQAEVLRILTEKLKFLAGEEKTSFIRINPIWERNEENLKIFRELGFRDAPLQIHPEASWKLDLTSAEKTLFNQMRKTTRYLIRQNQQNPQIRISQNHDLGGVKLFSQWHNRVSQRQYFVPFSLEYLQKEWAAFAPDNNACLFFGHCGKEVAAGAFVVFWSGIGFYHHAISAPQFTKLSIPYLLQWEAIKEAKKRGCRLYDFWGFVDPQKQPRHPWAGPTLFKMGFGGRKYEYVKTQDLALSKKYWLTWIFEKIRKLKRGL
jgi:lipid II:glycine glycyltransferase (peptidoglycan interpeptide bridge formation enzyme)